MRKRSGFTYAEVMVSALILSLLTGIGILLFQFAKRTEVQAEFDNGPFRQGSQAVSRLRRELRGSQILEPTDTFTASTELRYRYPDVESDGRLVVDSSGSKEWAGIARIFQDGSKLMLEKPVGGELQILADLEAGAFKVQVDPYFHWFLIEVKRPDEEKPAFKRLFRQSRIASP